MSIQKFWERNKNLLTHDQTVPKIIYDDSYFFKKKCWKVVKAVGPYGFIEPNPEGLTEYVRNLVDPKKIKRNSVYTVRLIWATPKVTNLDMKLDIVQGYGVTSGNLYNYKWGIEELQEILDKPDVRGLFFQNPTTDRTAFYEKTDTP